MRFLRHLPNLLTAARLPAIFLITVWTYWAGPWASAALALFILAALTDIFDGWIARKLNAVTDFDRLMAPGIETVILMPSQDQFVTSSSFVKDIARHKLSQAAAFVPRCVLPLLRKRLAEKA